MEFQGTPTGQNYLEKEDQNWVPGSHVQLLGEHSLRTCGSVGQTRTSGVEANRVFPVPSMMSKAKEAKKLEIRKEVEIRMRSKQVLRIESGSQVVHAMQQIAERVK